MRDLLIEAIGRVFVDFDQQTQFLAIAECERIAKSPGFRDTLPLQPCRGTFASNAQGRIYGFKTFADYFTQRQLELAMKGNTGMLVWLGKQWLGQSDRHEVSGPEQGPIQHKAKVMDLSKLTDEELAQVKRLVQSATRSLPGNA